MGEAQGEHGEDGTALWSVMANPQMTTMDFSFLKNIPWVIPVMAYVTILFEIYFPVMSGMA